MRHSSICATLWLSVELLKAHGTRLLACSQRPADQRPVGRGPREHVPPEAGVFPKPRARTVVGGPARRARHEAEVTIGRTSALCSKCALLLERPLRWNGS